MKKILTNILITVLLIITIPSVSAKVSSETLAEVIHTAEDTAYPEALEGKFDYGKNHSETDLLCDEIDLSKMYRRYTIIYPTEEFYDYYFIPENTGLFQFIRDESMDSEIYVGEGKAGKMYYIRINDPWYGITEKDVEENPELHAGAFKYGEEPYSLCHETTLTYNFDLDEYAEILLKEGIESVYDAYFSAFHIGSQTSQHKYYVMYFDTDKGEYILNIDSENVRAGQKSDEELEYMKLYPLSELYDSAKIVLNDITEYHSGKSGTHIDENGDDIEKEAKKDSEESKEPAQMTENEKDVQSEEKNDKKVIEDKDEEEKEELNQPEEKEEFPNPEKTEIDVTLYGGKLLFPDQKPVVDNERVLVPFRVIFEALGADVLWDGDTWTVTAKKGDTTISLTIGEKKIVKNGEVIDIDVPAQVQNERTLVPIRVVSESFGNTVVWNGENKTVEIK